MRWIDSPIDAELARRLARELEVSPLLARLLVQRGLAEPAAAHAFLHPSLGQLHAPELMAGMREAVARLRRALEQHEKILIYGDYDVWCRPVAGGAVQPQFLGVLVGRVEPRVEGGGVEDDRLAVVDVVHVGAGVRGDDGAAADVGRVRRRVLGAPAFASPAKASGWPSARLK